MMLAFRDRSGRGSFAALGSVLAAFAFAALLIIFAWQTIRDGLEPLFLLGGLFALALIVLVAFEDIHVLSSRRHHGLTIVDNHPEGLALTDHKDVLLHRNTSWDCLLAGYRPVDLLDTLHRDRDREALKQQIEDAKAGQSSHIILPIRSNGATTEWLSLEACPLPQEAAYLILWRAQKVTEDHYAEKTSQQHQTIINDLVMNVPIGLLSVNESGYFQFVSPTFARWLGYISSTMMVETLKLQDILTDQPFLPNYPSHKRLVHSQDETCYPVHFVARDGSIVKTQVVWTQISSHDHRTITHIAVRLVSMRDDWEKALRLSEQRFQHIFEEAPVAIALLDHSGIIFAANRALRSMVGERRLVGYPFHEIIPQEDQKRVDQRLAQALKESPPVPLDTHICGTCDPPLETQLFVSRAEAVAGTSSGFILHMLDASEQRKLERQFAQSQRMEAVGQLAGGIAHDFNNLLTAMRISCDELLGRSRSHDAAFEEIKRIDQSIARATTLVRGILAFSHSQQTQRPQLLSVTDALSEATHLLQRLIGAHITLTFDHGQDLYHVRMDPVQLEQVIINLALNARDAMMSVDQLAERKLTIRTRNITNKLDSQDKGPEGDYVLIEVEDNGPGIPTDILDRIFEPFFTTKERGQGTGLGLSLVYGNISQAGGHVFAKSTLDGGACFSVFLPRHDIIDPPHHAHIETPKRPEDLTGSGSILLVEDEGAVRVAGSQALRKKGYHVMEARDGEVAMGMLNDKATRIDLLITDIIMPHMSGTDLVNHVRASHPNIKVLFISGHAQGSARELLQQGGGIHFLPKPFSLSQLAGKVKDIMQGSNLAN